MDQVLRNQKRLAHRRRSASDGTTALESPMAVLHLQVQQQKAVASLSRLALEGGTLPALVDHAVASVARVLHVGEPKAAEALLLAGGLGMVQDLRTQRRFAASASKRAALPPAPAAPDGARVSKRPFTVDDTYFLQSMASILAESIRRKRAEDELKASHERIREQRQELEAVLDSMTEGVLTLDTKMRVRRANAFARRILGSNGTTLEGQSCLQVFRLQDEGGKKAIDLAERLRHCIHEREPLSLDLAWLALPQGRRVPITLTIAPYTGAQNGSSAVGATLLFRDITRSQETDALRESIVSLVSHELRTPLHHIKGFVSSLLQTDVEWDAKTKTEFTRSIDTETDRLTKLVNDILEMSRLQNGRLPMQLGALEPLTLVQSSLSQAEPFLRQHRTKVRVPGELPKMLADSARMERVLLNLLENAAKYSKPQTWIEVRAQRQGSELLFAVRDAGVGIPRDAHDSIFERFVRLRPQGIPQPPGVGLGLTFCKAVVESHGGRIWVESVPGEGSTFFFTVPVVPGER